ncbi:MAG: trigger factor [Patescibacteria group bacterium]
MNNTSTIYQNIKIKKLADSKVSIEAEVTEDFFNQCFKETTERFRQEFEAPGFRKGHVPEQIFLERVNQGHLLEEAAEAALRKAYPQIIIDNDIKPLATPSVTITKLAPKNPMGFKAEVTVRPEAKLPDYKKIAKKAFLGEVPIELREEEVETFIKQILDMEAKVRDRASENPKNTELPAVELTDELVKQLGSFENVEDFKSKIREDMLAQKKLEAARDKRENFAKQLIEASTLILPKEITEEEIESSFARILQDLKAANLTLEDYVKRLNKTEDEFRKEKREQIESQMKMRFLLEDIANEEKIKAPEEEVQAEVSRLRKTNPEARSDDLIPYVELLIRNEMVLRSLENPPVSELK